MSEIKTEQESLVIIRQMIESAKGGIKDDGAFLLLWGWLVFIASLSHFLLLVPLQLTHGLSALPWLAIFVIGITLNLIMLRKKRQTAQVKTYVGQVIGQIWLSIGICFMLLLGVALGKLMDFSIAYPFFILLYGLGTFLSGLVIQFRPLMVGAIASWLIFIAAFFVSFEYQLLLIALSILLSYLIPGYMLKTGLSVKWQKR